MSRPLTLTLYRQPTRHWVAVTTANPHTWKGKWEDALGDWRWTLTAGNNAVVGASTESYRRRIDAVKNAALVLGVHFGWLNVEVIRYIADVEGQDLPRSYCQPAIRVRVEAPR